MGKEPDVEPRLILWLVGRSSKGKKAMGIKCVFLVLDGINPHVWLVTGFHLCCVNVKVWRVPRKDSKSLVIDMKPRPQPFSHSHHGYGPPPLPWPFAKTRYRP